MAPRKKRKCRRRLSRWRRRLKIPLLLLLFSLVLLFTASYFITKKQQHNLRSITRTEEENEPCTNHCEHIANTLSQKCNLQKLPLELACLQFFWMQAGCTPEGLDYPRESNNPARSAPWQKWSKSKIIQTFKEYARKSREQNVQWMLVNVSQSTSFFSWIELDDADNIELEELCERADGGSRMTTLSWGNQGADGEVTIDLDNENEADGWFTHSSHNHDDGSRSLWGSGPVVRKVYRKTCTGRKEIEGYGYCKTGIHVDSELIAEQLALNLQREYNKSATGRPEGHNTYNMHTNIP